MLDNLATVAAGQREAGCHFDLLQCRFLGRLPGHAQGDAIPSDFPTGCSRFVRNSTSWVRHGTLDRRFVGRWSIGGNPDPDVQACLNYDCEKPETFDQAPLGRKAFCRATEPIRSMYTDAFRHHIRKHGVRLLKFDNTSCICVNPNHDHLPGLYSTEAIEDALIEFFRALDEECPDVFLMLYWGYKSPWWLIHGDTLFDGGVDIEAATPSDQPAPYLRDSITQKLDQSQWVANENVPPLGKDSLGVWLSDWPWNSQVGKQRWENGFIMDICRGSLLRNPGATQLGCRRPNAGKWPSSSRAQGRAGCSVTHNCLVLGDPHEAGPYGYCCSDGQRAFLAVHNCCWNDSVVQLELNSKWGLPTDQAWDLYRWYPDQARLLPAKEAFDHGVARLAPLRGGVVGGGAAR